jgi:hypothetical protein
LSVAVGFRTQLFDDAPVDPDATCQDQLLRLAPRSDARAGKNFLQSVCHARTRTEKSWKVVW